MRKWGDSNHGEFWDSTEWMDTYYNPVPHFGFDLAVRHSPNLWQVRVCSYVCLCLVYHVIMCIRVA